MSYNIDTTSLVDKVEEKLIELINSKKLSIGDSLPKELELTELFGVSRTVVREALLRLRTIGLIESKKHKGAVLVNPDVINPIKRILNPHVLLPQTLKEIFELRLIIEVGLADSIIARITEEDIQDLEAIIQNEPIHSDETLFEIDHEINFHGRLYEITKNQTVIDFQRMLIPIFEYVHKSKIIISAQPEDGFISHRELLEIIKKRDADALREAMRKHLSIHFKRILTEE
ncbi:FadR/GntR family transcriptional regulator [Sphingobacterium paucimobilis]|uniref:HTH gntR-type domain-containing protein n=1 Tax=Sphingobacterium paucimobilis HER1398 TaxID=1346330 RepID=U2HRQ8_9SPHI|nr:FadR/GntR family transcriptional regulator [Sphingobacterium paucimobilis]ERJ57970.1 hypothetical protein M472_04240 [Sphingobacterium paucimobilis HER1398]